MSRMSKLLALAATLLAFTPAQAVVYITNPFTGAYSFVGQTDATNLTTNISTPTFTLASELEKIGVASSAATDRFMASQWSTNSFDSTKYFEFSLTAEKVAEIPFAYFDSVQLDFALRRSSTGPRQFQWRSSLDAFAAPITSFTSLNPSITFAGGVLTVPDTASTDTYVGNAFSLSGLSPLNLTNITLRLYGYTAESVFGQAGLDTPLTFSGNVVVPEPSTVALLAFSATTFAWLRMRRRR
jgi:hypothetical protein